MNVKLLRTAKNLDVAVRFLGEKIDLLDEIVSKAEKDCNKDAVIKLDELNEDLKEIYELINNLTEELNENLKKGGKWNLSYLKTMNLVKLEF